MARKRRRSPRKKSAGGPLQRRRAHLEKLEDRWVIGSMLLSLPGGGMMGLAAQSLLDDPSRVSPLQEIRAKQSGASAAVPLGLGAWDSSLLKTADDDSTHLDFSASAGTSAASESWEDSLPASGATTFDMSPFDAQSTDAQADLLIDSYLAASLLGGETDSSPPAINVATASAGTSGGTSSGNLASAFDSPVARSSPTAPEVASSTTTSTKTTESLSDPTPVDAKTTTTTTTTTAEAPQALNSAIPASAPIVISQFPPNLQGWSVAESGGSLGQAGDVTETAGAAVMREGDSFLVTLEQTFEMPENVSQLAFTYADLQLDTTDPSFINDAFEVALVDADGNSLVATIGPNRDVFFNVSEDVGAALGAGATSETTSDGATIRLDVSGVFAGETARLIFRLVNNDSDTQSSVRILGVGIPGDNRPPEIDAVAGLAADEGQLLNLSTTFSDANAADTHTAVIHWGDGLSSAGVVTESDGQGTIGATHVYADNGSYPIKLELIDSHQQTAVMETTADIANLAPSLEAFVGFPGYAVDGPQPLVARITGAFTDPGFNRAEAGTVESFLLDIDWGDGVIDAVALDVTQGKQGQDTKGSFLTEHEYAQSGVFQVVVRVQDDDQGGDAVEFDYALGRVQIMPAVRSPGWDPIDGDTLDTSLPHGLIPVILESEATFDATQVEAASLRFYPGSAPDSDGQLITADVTNDGLLDGVAHFSTWEARLRPTDAVGHVTGELADGTYYVGFDTIRVTPASGRVPEAYDPWRTSADSGTKFFVVDASAGRAFRYTAAGLENDSFALESFLDDPRGITSNVAGDTVWVVDAASHQVEVRSPDGWLLGSWLADGLTTPEGIATDGRDIWIVDAALGQILHYPAAAPLRATSAAPAGSFPLHPLNTSPSGLTTDGAILWVSDEAADQVFVYDTSGAFLGRWSLDAENGDPSGITNDPTGGTDLWVVDRQDLLVYHYATGTDLRGGTASAAETFALAAANLWPEGIADPPADGVDLTISDIDTSELVYDGQTLSVTGEVSATVANVGTEDLAQSFEMLFFEDINFNGVYDEATDSVLGGTLITDPLLAGVSVTVTLALSGTSQFADNIVWGFVDSGAVITETNEDNNHDRPRSIFVPQPGQSPQAAPDLTASYLRASGAVNGPTITARIGNGGEIFVPPGVAVAFYDDDPEAGGQLLGTTVTTGRLEPGQFEDVSIDVASRIDEIWVVADDDGVLKTVYDAVADFSETTNTNASTWSYRSQSGTTRDGTYDLLPEFIVIPDLWDPDVGIWNPDPGNEWVGVNDTGAPVDFTLNANDFDWPTGLLGMHPGDSRLVVTSWLSPDDGAVDVSFSFADMDPNGGDGIAWSVDLNDFSGVIDSGVITNGGSPTGVISHSSISVSAGDRVNFVVSPNGGFLFDSTAVTATINFSAAGQGQHSESDEENNVHHAAFSYPSPEIVVASPEDGSDVLVGASVLLSGLAAALAPRLGSVSTTLGNEIVAVYVDNAPVEALDANGAFFTQIVAAPGQNVFEFTATDAYGQTTSATLTLMGTQPTPREIDFSLFADVSASLEGTYGRTSFDEESDVLYADMAVHNAGQYLADTPLIVGITNVSDPTVRVRGFDGQTPEGIPYFNYTDLVTDGALGPDEVTGSRTLAFYNPQRIQFTYDLVFLGRLNQAPAITTVPNIEAVAGRSYHYDSDATDPDGDTPAFSLLTGPSGILVDSASGEITWSPSADDVGAHAVALRVEDGRGGSAEQHYVLSAIEAPPNRPPFFTSAPVVDAQVNQPYSYDADATDLDGDSLTYALLDGPDGMTVDPNTGGIEWTPTADDLLGDPASTPEDPAANEHQVTVSADDGHGGVAVQTYVVNVQPDPTNHPPVITSEPITEFGLTRGTGEGSLVDLSQWTVQQYELQFQPNANWVLSEANTVATQTVNADASIFLSDFDVTTDRIDGTWRVNTSGDDDFMGFVFGYRDPQHFYLFDWKQTDQNLLGFADAGMSVKVVNADSPLAAADFWSTNASSGRVNTIFHNTIPWQDFTDYEFTLEFHPGEFTITVRQGATILESVTLEDDTYDSGRFGFYNFSQSDIRYSGFRREPLPTRDYVYDVDAIDPDQDILSYTLDVAPDGMTIDPSTGQTSWRVTLDNIGQHDVTVSALDGRGGVDTQSYVIDVQPDPDNHPPVITSEPVTTVVASEVPSPDPKTYRDVTFPLGDLSFADRVVTATPGANSEPPYDDPSRVLGPPGAFMSLGVGGSVVVEFVDNILLDQDDEMGGLDLYVFESGVVESFQVEISQTGKNWTDLGVVSGQPTGIDIKPFVSPGDRFRFVRISDVPPNESVSPRGEADIAAVGAIGSAAIVGSYQYDVEALDPDDDALTYSLVVKPDGMAIDAVTGLIEWAPAAQQLIVPNDDPTLPLLSGYVAEVYAEVPRPIELAFAPDGTLYVGREEPPLPGDTADFVRIHRIGPGGAPVEEYGNQPRWDPDSVAFDRDGTISGVPGSVLVGGGADTGLISAIFPDQTVQEILSSPFGPQALWNPSGLKFDSTGRLYASQVNSGQLFVSDGEIPRVLFEMEVNFSGFAIDAQDNVYAAGRDGTIRIYDRDGSLLNGAFATGLGSVNLAFGQGGAWGTDLYAFSGGAGEIRRIDAAGNATTIGTGFGNPPTFAFGPDGDLYVSERINNRILRLTPRPAEHPVTVRVTDGRGGVDEQPFVVQVSQHGVGEIHGTTFNDLDGDGQRGALEPGLEGWVVYADQNNNLRRDPGEQFTLTDELGEYTLLGLPPGSYTVRGEMQPRWSQTTPGNDGAHQIELALGQIVSGINFGSSEAEEDTNFPPLFTSSPPAVASVDDTLRYDATASDADHDILTFDLVVQPDGMAVSPTSGVLVWNPTLSQVGEHDVILRVRDGRGGVDLQAFQVTVGTNSAPVITSLPFGPAVVDLLYQYNVTAQDADGDELTFSLPDGPDEMTIDADTGVLTWTPESGDVGDHSVSVRVADGRGGEDTQSFLLPVAPAGSVINQPPTISSSPRTSVGLETLYTYFVQASDPNHDPLIFSLDESPPGMDIDQTGVVSWTPAADQLGDHPVTVRVEDGRGGFATQRFAIGVAQQTTNSPPTITSVPPFTAQVDQSYEYNALAVDPDNDPVVWSLLSGPDGLSIDALRGALRWTPGGAQIGFHEVVIQATDTQGASGIQGFGLNVGGTNSPPVVSSAPPTLAFAGDSYFYPVRAVDANNDPLDFSLTTGPDGMTIGNTTGLIQWTPTTDQTGTHNVVLRVEDGRGGVGEQGFTLSVSGDGPNAPPVITSTPEFVATVDQTYEYQLDATDPEGLSLTYQRIDGPTAMNVNPATGLVTWTPTLDQLGANVVQLAAFDPLDLGASQTFSITVREDNRPPALDNTPTTTAVAGKLYAFDMNVTDPDDDAKIFTLTGGPQGMTLDELGRLRWTPTLDDAGVHRVEVTIRDDRGSGITFGYDLTVVVDDTPPQVVVNVNTNPAGIGEDVTFWVAATDNIAIESIGLEIDGAPVALDGSGAATLSFDAFGVVGAVATATDTSGNTAQASLQLSVIDTSDVDAPVVQITAPEFDQVITAPIDVIGTVSDTDGLLNYKLELAAVDAVFEEIARGDTEVIDGVLGQLDPTLLENDSYILRLTAEDAGGNIAATETLFDVAGSLKVGNFTLSFVDLSTQVQGIPIVVGRTYDTLAANRSGDFGFGWRLNLFDVHLRDNVPRSGLEDVDIFNPYRNGTRIYLRLPDGSREAFTVRPKLIDNSIAAGLLFTIANYVTVEFVPDPGVTSRLELSRNFTLQLTDAGELINPNGLPFNPASSLFRPVKFTLTTKEGIAFQIDPVNGALDHITDRNGNRLTVDADGVSSTSGRNVEFRRDPQGRITAVVDPMGNSINYEYDAAGDLVAVTDREGATTRFAYNSRRPHFLEEIIDPLGRTGARSEYDDEGRLVRILDVNGNPTELIHDVDNFIETVRDALGNETVLVYDTRGNVVTQIDAAGGVIEHRYDDENNPEKATSLTNQNGQTTRFAYDSRGNITSITDPLGNTTRSTYDAQDNRLSVSDQLGNTTTLLYDSRGSLISTTDVLGNVTTLSYDPTGNLVSLTNQLGAVSTFEYDDFGRVVRRIDALANDTRTSYDENGNLLVEQVTNVTPTGTEVLVTTHSYDSNGRLVSTTNAEGGVTRFEYDPLANQIAVIDANGHRTDQLFDTRNQLQEVRRSGMILASFEYDELGRRIAATDVAGRTTRFQYDAVGQEVLRLPPDETPDDITDNPNRRTEYDPAGNVVAEIDELGRRTEFGYDDAGRRTVIHDPLGNESHTIYSPTGRVVANEDALGRTTRFEYDALGRHVATIHPDGSTLQNEYDAASQVISSTDQAGLTTRFEYDTLGRLVSVTDPLTQTTRYSYDSVGNLATQMDALGRVTAYGYDAMRRRIAVVRPQGERSEAEYDAVGNLISSTDFNGNTTLFEYDIHNRLTAKRFPDGLETLLTYTPQGEVETVADNRGVTRYAYNSLGRLVSRREPDAATITYGYDAVGRLTTVTTLSGATTYSYNAINRLESVTDADAGVTRYEYDEIGNLAYTEFPNDTGETREYDDLNQLIFITTTGSDGVITSYEYELDAVGNRTSVREHSGRRVEYTYDELYRLVGENVIVDPMLGERTIQFSYDAVGNRVARHDSVEGLTEYVYDDNDRLLVATQGDEETLYTYDDNGNLLSRVTDATNRVSFAWNSENRLVEAEITTADGTRRLEYEYDADGDRVTKRVDGEETRFLVDKNRPLSQVIEEYLPGGDVKTSYVYGNDLVSLKQSGERSYYHVDGHGSTTALTNEAGSLSDRYVYDAFGNELARIGITENNYLFSGEQRDPDLNLDYLRARYFDSETGRFVTTDPFEGQLQVPSSLHRYMYAGANPVMNIDPSGLFTGQLVELLQVMNLREVIRRFATPVARLARAYCSSQGLRDGLQVLATLGQILLEVATTNIFEPRNLESSRLRIGSILTLYDAGDRPSPILGIQKIEYRVFRNLAGERLKTLAIDLKGGEKIRININSDRPEASSVDFGANIPWPGEIKRCGVTVAKLEIAIRFSGRPLADAVRIGDPQGFASLTGRELAQGSGVTIGLDATILSFIKLAFPLVSFRFGGGLEFFGDNDAGT